MKTDLYIVKNDKKIKISRQLNNPLTKSTQEKIINNDFVSEEELCLHNFYGKEINKENNKKLLKSLNSLFIVSCHSFYQDLFNLIKNNQNETLLIESCDFEENLI